MNAHWIGWKAGEDSPFLTERSWLLGVVCDRNDPRSDARSDTDHFGLF